MSCITSTMTPQAPALTLSCERAASALRLVCALVCSNSVGTVELLYVEEGVLLTDQGDVFTVRRQ